ncbi:MAG: hypothetical protein A2Z64_01225 [Betaproteobacteria bacterium RIFCSPLOWO2_02_67_12]|nr:MAG: hypothetical protein A2Z64_01225 [Betaproteobacteria bacterium RIFCSPLOWO2_02_67_12]
MKIALRLLREFWLPALLAVGWTAYNVKNAGAVWDFKALLNIFGPTFFLVSWATGQFFRIKKQAHVEQNLTSIEGRVESLVTKIEKHIQDFLGYTTGADSLAYFLPMITAPGIVALGLKNTSTYPVFDIQAEVIDLDEPIDPDKGKFWTRQRFSIQSLYPSKIVMGAYRFDLRTRERLNINVFIQTRTQGLIQQFRIVKTSNWMSIAIKTTAGEKVIERVVPADFPGVDPADPDAVFK